MRLHTAHLWSTYLKESQEFSDGCRTPPDHNHEPRLNLKILSEVREKNYKGKIIRTKTMDCVHVQLYDGGNPISHDHPLASAMVELVILKEEFNNGQKYWSKEDFINGLKRHGEGNTPMRIKNCTFNLVSGYASHASAIILDNSNRKEVRLGVRMVGHHEERVLEGISNEFRVQEAKTERKRCAGQQLQVPMNNSSQPTIAQSATVYREERILAANSQQLQVPMNEWSQPIIAQSVEHGQILPGNSPQNVQLNSMIVPLGSSSHTTISQSNNITTGQVEAGFYQQCFQQKSMDTSYGTTITHNVHGETSQILQDFNQLDTIYRPAIWGGNDLTMLSGFQTKPTGQQDGTFPERDEYAGYLHPQTQNQVIPNLQSGNGESIIINRAQLLWDETDVEPRQCWNSFGKLMPVFPEGFMFNPTEKELVEYYLAKKVASMKIDFDIMQEVDLYQIEPWDLQEMCGSYGRVGGAHAWYFFSFKDRKYLSGMCSNRATAAGYWNDTGHDRPVMSSRPNMRMIGMCKTLVYYEGRAPNGRKTDWIVNEYRLQSNERALTQEDGWVACHAFQKPHQNQSYSNPTSPTQSVFEANGYLNY